MSITIYCLTLLQIIMQTFNKFCYSHLFSGVNQSAISNRPLTKVELRSFQSKCKILLKEITLKGPLLDSLIACHCISAKHKKEIKNKSPVNTGIVCKPVNTDRVREFVNTDGVRELVNTDGVRELLRIMRRRSSSQFQLFLSCLMSTSQKHVIDVLQSPGGI